MKFSPRVQVASLGVSRGLFHELREIASCAREVLLSNTGSRCANSVVA